MEHVFSAVLGLILTIIRTIFYDSFMPRKKGALPFWVTILLFSSLSIANQYLLDSWAWLKQIVAIIIGIIIAKALYKTSINRAIIVSVLFTAISSLVDVASSYALVTISGMSLEQLRSGVGSFLIGAGMAYILLFAISLILRKIRTAKNEETALTYKEIIRLLIFPVVSAFVLVAMLNVAVDNSYTSPLIFLSVIGLLAANIALVFIVDKLEYEQKAREENKILQQQISLEMSNINALMELNSTQARIAHDHTNHLSAIGALLANSEVKEAQEYIDTLVDRRESTQYTIRTNNPVADAVLNLKYLLAKRNNIHMSVDVNDLAQFPLRSEELATVLSNILDNAIEACSNVKEKPKIKIKIWCEQDESIISVRNTTAYPVVIRDNKVKTTKVDIESHGFGLKNVATVLARHEYDYAIGYTEGWFQFTAIL